MQYTHDRHPIRPQHPTARPSLRLTARLAARHMAAATLAGLAALALPAQAIVSTSSPSNWVASDDSFDGVAKLTISASSGTAVCSGSLLAGGAYVLTAAHCVTGTSSGAVTASRIALSFDSGRVTATVSSAAQITVYTGWNTTLGQNNDLALLRLDTALTRIDGYDVLGSSALGSTVVLAGYGYSGVGNTGYTDKTLTTLHWGENQYDSVYAATRTTSGGSVLYDFDNGTAARNSIGGLGLGTYEAMIASGDSGGPSFVQTASGSLLLVGVHSFGARLTNAAYDIDTVLDGSYGELGGDTTLSSAATLSWLSSVAQVSAVPEPASAALLAAGGALLLAARRRRTA